MSKGAMNFNEGKIEYYTPKKVLDYFRALGYNFEFDPATTPERATYHQIPYFCTKDDNGLTRDWALYQTIWINPPFNQKKEFWQKVVQTFHRADNDIFFLCPANFLPTASFTAPCQPISIWIPEGRIAFESTPKGGGVAKSPAFGAVIVKPDHLTNVRYIPKEWLK